jgi:DNA-binding CsgD family transcriptional regulator
MDIKHKLTTQCCRQTLNTMAQKVGAVDAAFVIDFDQPQTWLGRHWLSGIKNRSSLLYTSAQVEHISYLSRHGMNNVDQNVLKTVQRPIHVWTTNSSSKIDSLKADLLKQHGYSKQISISYSLSNLIDLKGIFNFFYPLDCELSENELINNIQHALVDLGVVGSYIVSERILLSPFEDYHMLKPATVSIVRNLAKGCSRSELSERHFMTARGVDYHIEKAKVMLGAKNTSHLVYVANKMLLL